MRLIVHIGGGRSASVAEILREIARARSEARIIARSRGMRFSEHLSRTPDAGPLPFDTFLKRQNEELRAAAKRREACGPGAGRVIDIYG